MEKIIKIKKNKTKVKIVFQSGKEIELFPSTFADFNLYINKIIEENTVEEILKANKIEELFKYSVKRISSHEYSPKKIEEFLIKKGAKTQEIKNVIQKLRKFNYLDESKLIEEISQRCDAKHYGYNRLIKILKDKKISEEEILKIKYNLNREIRECKNQIILLEKRYKNKNNFQRRKSIFSALIRYGFEEDISLELVNKICNLNHIHEINVLKLDYDKYFSKYSKKYSGRELNERITRALLGKGYRINDINEVKEK